MSLQSYIHTSVNWILIAAFCICQMLIQKQRRDCSSCLKGCGTLAWFQLAVCPTTKPSCKKKVGAGSSFTTDNILSQLRKQKHVELSLDLLDPWVCNSLLSTLSPTLPQKTGQEGFKFTPVWQRRSKGSVLPLRKIVNTCPDKISNKW